MSDPRYENINNLILKYTLGDYTVRGTPSEKGDELDAIIIGLNTLAEEIQSSGKQVKDYDKRIGRIMDVVMKYTLFDFSEQAEISDVGDELDAVAIGLNTLAEELLTARKNEEFQLRNIQEANKFMDAVLEHIPNMVFVKDAKELKFIRFNKAGEELIGISREQMIGKSDYDFFPKNQADAFTSKDREALLKSQVTDIPEEPIDTTTGKKWLHTKKIPINDELGNPIYLLGVSEDITERKKTEFALRQSEERLRLLIENIKDYAIFMIDPNGYVINWNKGAQKIKGYTAAEIIGKHFSTFYTDEDIKAGKPMHHLKEALKRGSYEDEYWRVRKDGTKFWADVILSPLYDEKNQLHGFSKITRDITERKEAEQKVLELNMELEKNVRQLEALNSELEAFTYSVSHDLRAPLRAIHGYTKIIEQEYASKLDSEAKHLMNLVMANAKKMGKLIEDLLALSHLGKKELIKKQVDMTELARTALEELKNNIDENKTQIILNPLPPALADEGLMLQVFTNLLSNAIKYSSKKENPVIEIGSKEINNKTVYYIKDNGSGFNMMYYNKLFGIFQRLHDASEFEGTGVGLAIVKRIILRHNGKIWAESELGKGATFYFTLKST